MNYGLNLKITQKFTQLITNVMIFMLYFITVLRSSLAIDYVGSGIIKMSCVLLESNLDLLCTS